MAQYLVKRLLSSLLVIVCVLFVVSILIRIIPGDPVDVIMAGNPGITAQQKEALRQQLGLRNPILVQFAKYAQGMLHGDLGMSLRYRISSTTLVMERLPATIELTLSAMLIAILIAVPLGIITAIKQNTAIDYAGSVVALIGVSVPNFLLGILLILVFAVEFAVLPASGRAESLAAGVGEALSGQGLGSLADSLRHLVLPSLALGLSVAAANTRMIRSAMLDAIQTDYTRLPAPRGCRRESSWSNMRSETRSSRL